MFTEILIELRPLGAVMYRKNETRFSRYSVTSYSLEAATGSV